MTLAADKLWHLLAESGLLTTAEVFQLQRHVERSDQNPTALTLAKWLVKRSMISRYQANILLAGRPGPFHFDAYRVIDRVDSASRRGQFHGIHVASRHPVLLDFLEFRADETPEVLMRRLAASEGHCRLTHPCLTRCYSMVRLPDYKFMVLEDPSGTTLAARIHSAGPLPVREAVQQLHQLARGLSALHQAGLVQGDLRPDRITLQDQFARWIRFPWRQYQPLAASRDDSDAVGRARAAFAAPELAQSGRWPDALTDIYGLGCLFFYMLTGQPLVAGNSPEGTLLQHATVAAPDCTHLPGWKPGMSDLLGRMLAKSAANRCESAAEISQCLQPWLTSDQPLVVPPPGETLAAFLRYLPPPELSPPNSNPDQKTELGQSSPVIDRPIIETRFSPGRKKSKRPFRSWLLRLVALSCALLTLLLARGLLSVRSSPDVNGPYQQTTASRNERETIDEVKTETTDQTVAGRPSADRLAAANQRYQITADDGQALWAPPTQGVPMDLRYAPQGGQFFLSTRPAEILANPEGQRVVQALGPAFARCCGAWEKQHAIELAAVRQLIVMVAPDNQGVPQTVCDLTLDELNSVPDLWRSAEGESFAAGRIVHAQGLACFVPSVENGLRLIVGPAITVREIAQREDRPPLLRRELEILRRTTDDQLQFSLLFTPTYLLRDGRQLFAPAYSQLPAAWDRFLGDGIQAALFTAHIAPEETFFELRLETTVETRRPLFGSLGDRLGGLAGNIEAYITGLDELDHHWRPVALRFDNMIRFVVQQTRRRVEGGQVVMNASLPVEAAHNLVLASELALAAGVSSTSKSKLPVTPRLATMDDILRQRTSLSIRQQSLEFCVLDLMSDVNQSVPRLPYPFVVRIAGSDLQLEGMTRNQQIRDFRGDNQTVAELLTKLVMHANPITTVQSPADKEQKLVWVVEETPQNAENPIILITTRTAAEVRGRELPAVFRAE